MTFDKLLIHLVSSPLLKMRKKYITNTLDNIKNIAEEYNFSVSVNIISEPDINHIEQNIDKYNKRVNLDKNDSDDEFNNLNQKLTIGQISNMEKHRNIYNLIANINDDKVLHFIIEDDILISNDYINNIKLLFKNINNFNNFNNWDILFTSVSNNIDNDDIDLLNSIDFFKIIISKSSYFIKKSIVSKLNNYLETIKYPLKIALSKFIVDNKNTIQSKILNKHTFLEGSKIGIFLSSISPNNFLYQNNDFVKIAKLLNTSTITNELSNEAEKIYRSNQLNLNNADFQHSMGILYYKNGDYDTAKKYLIDAVYNIKKNEGFLNMNSEILNNCINMHQFNQPDLEECLTKKSKY